MKKRFLISILGIFLCCSSLLAYTRVYPHRPGGINLRAWFIRDLKPYDQRYAVVLVLRKLRSLIARSEALNLPSTEKAALEGLCQQLEKEMAKSLSKIKKLSRNLERELKKPDPDLKRCQKWQEKINQEWAYITQESLEILSRASRITSTKSDSRNYH